MPISPIGSIPTAASVQPSRAVTPTTDTAAATESLSSTQSNGNLFSQALQNTSDAQASADDLIKQATTGDLQDLTSVMSAMTEAQLSTQLTVALRNRAVESFNEIMRMQL